MSTDPDPSILNPAPDPAPELDIDALLEEVEQEEANRDLLADPASF
jgi:hypothetical protein